MPRQLSIFSNHLQKWLCGSSYLPLIMARLYTPNRIEPSVEAISIFIHLFTFRSGDIHSNLFSYGKTVELWLVSVPEGYSLKTPKP
jgi:hypothetical protein